MAVYLFLDEEPDIIEMSTGAFAYITAIEPKSWMSELGFLWCGRLEEDMTYFVDSSHVTPFPNMLKKKEWLTGLLDHYRALEKLRYSPEYPERIAELHRRMDSLEKKRQDILVPAREFSAARLTEGNYDSSNWRLKNREARNQLFALYRCLKSTPEYLEATRELEDMISENRDLLEAECYPATVEAAQEMVRNSLEFASDAHRPLPTIPQKIESIQTALASLNTLQGQKDLLCQIIRSCVEKHTRVGLGVAPSLVPMPTGIVDQKSFLADMPLPLPQHRIFIIFSERKTSD